MGGVEKNQLNLSVISHLFAVPILVLWVLKKNQVTKLISSLSSICNPNFSFMGGVEKKPSN
jgi:hypothetical protein